jgi:GGDEF domain-containing protein
MSDDHTFIRGSLQLAFHNEDSEFEVEVRRLGTIELGASIGVACSTPGMTGDTLVSLADQAMYAAKSQGTGPVIHQAG